MYLIYFRTISHLAASIAVSTAEIGALVEALELAKAQYKVYQDAAYLPPQSLDFGSCAGWLAQDQEFTQ